MNLITSSVELITQEDDFDGMLKHIEKCGRTCYKSEHKITDNSYNKFVYNMLYKKHYAMLEHGTIYITLSIDNNNRYEEVKFSWYKNGETVKWQEIYSYIQKLFAENPYSVINFHYNDDFTASIMCITTNYRVIIENDLEEEIKSFISNRTIYHIPRITLKFITNIGVTREGNRMRANSIAEESTRYCNYSNENFGKEVTFTIPSWLDPVQVGKFNCFEIIDEIDVLFKTNNIKDDEERAELTYLYMLASAEVMYMELLADGWTPQQAREALPLATKSEVVYTAFPHQWKHFFDLRLLGTTGKPHPNMLWVAQKARDVLIENNLWNLIYNPDDKNC